MDNGVAVYNIKTYAFTSRQTQLETTNDLLNWQDGVGNVRLNNTEDIKLSMDKSCPH